MRARILCGVLLSGFVATMWGQETGASDAYLQVMDKVWVHAKALSGDFVPEQLRATIAAK